MQDERIISLYNLTDVVRLTIESTVGDRQDKKGSVAHCTAPLLFRHIGL
jgi:hypothetical protein